MTSADRMSRLAAAWDLYTTKGRDKRFTWGRASRRWLKEPTTPGVEVLDVQIGQRVLDLGCGTADNAAHVAALGARVTAVDLSPVQVAAARQRWGHLANLTVEHVEAVSFLRDTDLQFDAVYSVYGAAWYTDPEELLPMVRARLRSGGVFAFNHAQADPAIGRTCLDSTSVIERWDFPVRTWEFLLRTYGFRQVMSWELPPTKGFPEWPTVLVVGQAG